MAAWAIRWKVQKKLSGSTGLIIHLCIPINPFTVDDKTDSSFCHQLNIKSSNNYINYPLNFCQQKLPTFQHITAYKLHNHMEKGYIFSNIYGRNPVEIEKRVV
jgi:hypothetical protein